MSHAAGQSHLTENKLFPLVILQVIEDLEIMAVSKVVGTEVAWENMRRFLSMKTQPVLSSFEACAAVRCTVHRHW